MYPIYIHILTGLLIETKYTVSFLGVIMSADCSTTVVLPFHSAKEAEIAYNTLRVDKEPPRGGCVKSLSTDGAQLRVTFTASEPRKLRVAVNSFFDLMTLVVETIHQFGPPTSQ